MGKPGRSKSRKTVPQKPARQRSSVAAVKKANGKAGAGKNEGRAKTSSPAKGAVKANQTNAIAKAKAVAAVNRRAQPAGAIIKGAVTPPPAKTLAARATAPVGKKSDVKPVKRKASEIVLPDDYRPTEAEPFMGDYQRAYFRRKLLQWKEDIIQQNRETLHVLHEDTNQHADLADRATSETDRALELRARDRQRKLVSKIDQALARIEDGSYGYCEETGEPISLKRLDARPIATLSLEAQERHERRERVYREE
jgi:DnaK suppressor protein